MNDCPCCMPPCSIAAITTRHTHMKIKDDGSEVVWIADHGDALNDIVYEPVNGCLYIGSEGTTNSIDDAYFRRIDLDSNIVWSKYSPFNEKIWALASFSNGDIVTGDNSGGGGLFRQRWNSFGVSQWKFDNGTSVQYNGVAVDPSDNVYIIDNAGYAGRVMRFPSTGLSPAAWTVDIGIDPGVGNFPSGTALSVATTGTQVCMVGAYGTAPGIYSRSMTMLDASGNVLWKNGNNETLRAAAFMSNGNVVVVGKVSGMPGFFNDKRTTYCYSPAGAILWHANHGAEVFAVAVDSSNNVYTGGSVSTGYFNSYNVFVPTKRCTVRKYNSSGVEQWNFDYLLGRPIGQVNSIAVDNAGYVYLAGTRVDTIIQP